nr:energy transducer TonB [Lysobacter pythonis]
MALACALAACGGKDETAAETRTAPTTDAAAPAVSAQVSVMGADQLRAAAGKAVSEQRLYAPAGENAMEYYLALRDKIPGDAAVASALTDLQPYALIAIEQAIGRDDFAEAKRLFSLLEKTDPNAPALPRLKIGIADAEATFDRRKENAAADETRRLELEKQRREQQQRMQQQAAQQLAAKQAEANRLAAARQAEEERQQQEAQAAEERRQAELRAAAQRQAANPAPPPPAPAAPPRAASTELRALSTPQPRYPGAALRNGQSGSVQVEFTVGLDGSVTSARVVSANPPRVFNNEVLNAVRRWRFQAVDAPVTTRRTFTFNPQE